VKILFVAIVFGVIGLVLLSMRGVAKSAPHGGIVFMGSSSIERWTTLQKDFPGARVVNRGVGGTELSDAIADLRNVIPLRPRIVVLYAGDNDIANGRRPIDVYYDFKTFVAQVHAALPDTRIVYISIKPSPSRWHLKGKIVAGNALINAVCARNDRLRFADTFSKMIDEHRQPRQELFVDDMLHLNAEGYRVWKKVVAPLLN
jgi:lysophospholipase L1-like esterase